MIAKTISGHYDTVFSIEHNNRVFTPGNVDANRTYWNYNCVAAGQQAALDFEDPRSLLEFWVSYRALSKIYWEDRLTAKKHSYEEYQEHLMHMRRYRHACRLLSNDGICGLVTLFFLPLLVPCGIYLNYQMEKAKNEYQKLMEEQWIRDMEFKAVKLSFREAIAEQDKISGTQYLQIMDSVVREMAQQASDYISFAKGIPTEEPTPVRYATLEEIYNKLYEPSFREFQSKQRPCRRYNGTYLESIREGRRQESMRKQQSKNSKMRKTAEAIEIVFGIGDMDNTGYINAFSDAKQSEALLKDFCDHLLEDRHLCIVTTKELDNPDWKPPFKNGLIVLNLTVHCDEATPGVHLTCIPYSSGCKRGPSVQAALGRAMTGMGYPSTWTDMLDENGLRIPKKSKTGEIVYNEDGTIRYQQKPDKQGIIDWIEEQKSWLQKEMAKRYGWAREYKGSHPRGNLSTPDYKVARARERTEQLKAVAKEELDDYMARAHNYSLELQSDVKQMLTDTTDLEKLLFYLKHCSEADYQRIVNEVHTFWSHFAVREEKKILDNLSDRIKGAQKKSTMQNHGEKANVKNEKWR